MYIYIYCIYTVSIYIYIYTHIHIYIYTHTSLLARIVLHKYTDCLQVRSMGAQLHGYYPEIGTTLAVPS